MRFTRAGLCGIALGVAIAIPTHAQQPQLLAGADSAFGQGAFQIAADRYRAIVQQNPMTDVAWYRLGVSLERLNRSDDAIVAYTRAAQFPNQQLPAEIGLTRVLTRAGNTTGALVHLRRAAGAGVDPALLDQLPALAPLRDLPEYADIRKTAEAVRYPCRDVHTFDFWVGDFDAVGLYQTKPGGQLHNTREYDGCVLIEHWMPNAGGGGAAGMSLAYYDTNRGAWRFIWNDVTNQSIEFEGNYRDGAMRLEAWFPNPDGTRSLARNVLQNTSPDTIRHTFSVSNDSGKTWTTQTDERFIRRRP